MHSLTFASYAAVLDPVTGLGVLLLPDQPAEAWSAAETPLDGVDAPSNLWLDEDEYVAMMRQLRTIGWVLPEDEDGRPTWFDAGPTDCCGRVTINLHGLDAIDADRELQQQASSCRRILELAAAACCGERAVAESVTEPAWKA